MILLIAGFLVGLLVFEGFLRLFYWVGGNWINRDNYADTEFIGSDLAKNEENLKALYRYDAMLGWKLNPGVSAVQAQQDFKVSYSVNKEGFRDNVDYSRGKESDKKRIIIFGDSFTFGVGVPNEKTFPKILEAESGGKYEVLNFGVSGYDPGQYFLSLKEEGLKYEPDIVLYAIYLGNDVIDIPLDHLSQGDKYKPYFTTENSTAENSNLILKNVPVPIRKANPSPDSRIKGRLLKPWLGTLPRLETVKLLKNVLRDNIYSLLIKIGWIKGIADYDYEFEILSKLLDETKVLLANKKSELVVIIIPSDPSKRGYATYLERGFDEKLTLILKAQKIPFLDLAPEMVKCGRDCYFSREGHWNEEGHRLAAEALAQFLLSNNR